MTIYDYFAALERGIKRNRKIGYLAEPLVAVVFDEHRGFLHCDVFFWDGSRLAISETVDTSPGYPRVTDYSYTYLRENQHVFRYDNAPHHPELRTFPHHKHVGPDEVPIAAEQPTLAQVFAEVGTYLSAEAGGPGASSNG